MIKSQVLIRKVWRSEISGIAFFLFFSVLSVIITHKYPEIFLLKNELFQVFGYRVDFYLPLLWFAPLVALGAVSYKIYNVRYLIDNRGVEATEGRLAMNQSIFRVRYEDIRAIDINQTLLERMLDIGTVEIGTAASADSEVFLKGIEAPGEVKDMLDRERDARRRTNIS